MSYAGVYCRQHGVSFISRTYKLQVHIYYFVIKVPCSTQRLEVPSSQIQPVVQELIFRPLLYFHFLFNIPLSAANCSNLLQLNDCCTYFLFPCSVISSSLFSNGVISSVRSMISSVRSMISSVGSMIPSSKTISSSDSL